MNRPMVPALFVLVPALLLVSAATPRLVSEPASEGAAYGLFDEGPIAEQMEVISSGMKQLRRALREEGQNEKCLTILVELEKATIEAKGHVPPMAESLPEGDRSKFIAGYRKTMCELMTNLLALETALIDDDKDAITAAFQKVRGMEDSGHERYTEDG